MYSGNARLWQGDTTIRGDAITVDDKTGNLEATGAVQTEMTLDRWTRRRASARRRRTKGSAELFVYDDAKRLATYTDKAHIDRPDGRRVRPRSSSCFSSRRPTSSSARKAMAPTAR